jgi:hypothetical protein
MIEYLNDNDNRKENKKRKLQLCMWNLSMLTMRAYTNITHVFIYSYLIKVIIDYTRESE